MRGHTREKAIEAIAALGLALLIGLPGAAQTGAETVVFEGARLIDGTGRPPVEGSALIVAGGRIRAVGKLGETRYPKGSRVINLRGKTIMPALTNLHGHLGLTQNGLAASDAGYEDNVRAQLERYLAYGVGTVLVLGTDQEMIYQLREAQRASNFPGARFFTAGRGFGVAGGYPPAGTTKPQDVYRPTSPDEARAQVRELAAHHPDLVKMWVDDDFGRLPKMKPEIYRAIIEAAHTYRLRVIAHVFYLADAKALLEAGIDGLGHSIRDSPVDREFIEAMKARGVFLLPTLVRDESTFIYAQSAPWLEDPFFQAGVEPAVLSTLRSPSFIEKFRANPNLGKLQAAFEMAKKNLKTLVEAGVRIGFGTDSGPPLRFQGYFEHRELQLMVESGLTPMQAIGAATSRAAEILRSTGQFGTLEPGKRADFLVLDANPLEDIHNTEKLSAVYQSGRRMHGLAVEPAAPARNGLPP